MSTAEDNFLSALQNLITSTTLPKRSTAIKAVNSFIAKVSH